MACECLEAIGKKLDEKYGGETDFTNVVQTMNFKTGEVGTSLEPLRFSYPVVKKDGTPSKKRKNSYVMFTYCPFCGKRYAEPKETEAVS
jgi:hypothetical protein